MQIKITYKNLCLDKTNIYLSFLEKNKLLCDLYLHLFLQYATKFYKFCMRSVFQGVRVRSPITQQVHPKIISKEYNDQWKVRNVVKSF